jgi:hypothetical protein
MIEAVRHNVFLEALHEEQEKESSNNTITNGLLAKRMFITSVSFWGKKVESYVEKTSIPFLILAASKKQYLYKNKAVYRFFLDYTALFLFCDFLK